MVYQKQTWVNDVGELSAARMSHIEDGIETASNILWTTYRVTSDWSNNTSTYAEILSVPAGLEAGVYWVLVGLTGVSASGGFSVGINKPQNGRCDGYQRITISSSSILMKWIAGSGPGINADSEHTTTNGSTFQFPMYDARFLMVVSATTTTVLAIALKATTPGSNIVVKPGSYLAVGRLS